jgi:hypothetical protein
MLNSDTEILENPFTYVLKEELLELCSEGYEITN